MKKFIYLIALFLSAAYTQPIEQKDESSLENNSLTTKMILPELSDLQTLLIGVHLDDTHTPEKLIHEAGLDLVDIPNFKGKENEIPKRVKADLIYNVLKEGQPTTFDYLFNRLNIIVNNSNVVEDIYFG